MIYKYKVSHSPIIVPVPTSIVTSGETIKKFLDIQIQDGDVVVWAEVERDDSEPKHYEIIPVWTGFEEPRDKGFEYLGTIQAPTGLVYHYYGNLKNKGE